MKFARNAAMLGLLLFQLGSSAGIHLKYQPVNPHRDRAVTALPSINGQDSHWILQFKDFPSAGRRLELARRGVRVLDYVPDSALIVSFHRSADLTGLNITWTGQLTPADRTAPGLETAPTFVVVFHGDVLRADAERLLDGFKVLDAPGLLPNRFLVAADLKRLPELATHDQVSYILPGDVTHGDVSRNGFWSAITFSNVSTDGHGWKPRAAAGNCNPAITRKMSLSTLIALCDSPI